MRLQFRVGLPHQLVCAFWRGKVQSQSQAHLLQDRLISLAASVGGG